MRQAACIGFLLLVATAMAVGCEGAPQATHSPPPTSVPALTPTSPPTPSPHITLAATPKPKSTLLPTATSGPAPTLVPTATPHPTPTRLPTASTPPTPSPTPETMIGAIDCTDHRLIVEIIELSEERENTFSPRILTLYEDKLEEVERSTKMLICQADAKLSAGGDFHITYRYEVDRDGNAVISYTVGDPVLPLGANLNDAFPIGATMRGADGTEIRELQTIADARPLVYAEDNFNGPPKEGNRFVMVRVEVVNPSDALQSVDVSYLEFELIGNNRVIYTFSDGCGVIPNELDREIFPGGREEGNVCFEIPETEGGLILVHKPGSETETRRFLQLGEVEDPAPIVFSDLNWTTVQVQTRIAQFIVENGYGHPTDTVVGLAGPNLKALRKGDIEVSMEVWLPNQQDDWDEAVALGQVVSLGKGLGESWESNFVIPKYVADQYPGLRTIEDLKNPEYNSLFQTHDFKGKARLVGCPANWSCDSVAQQQIESYGLIDFVEVVLPGNQDALFSDPKGNYSGEEPWLGYIWGTADPALVLDLVRLEEPPYTEECWATTKACAFEDITIIIAAHASLEKRAPDIAEFLRNWDLDIERYMPIAKYIHANLDLGIWDLRNDQAWDAAIWYLKNYEGGWSEWVPAGVSARVREALKDEITQQDSWSREPPISPEAPVEWS